MEEEHGSEGCRKKNKSKKMEFRHLVDRFREMKQHDEIAQEREFHRRRETRKEKKLAIQRDKKLLWYKRIYLLSGVITVLGIIMTFGSIVQGLGEGTMFWTYRHIFSICGPVFLVIAVILLMTATGLVFEHKAKLGKKLSHEREVSKTPTLCSEFDSKSSRPLLLSESYSSTSSATDQPGKYFDGKKRNRLKPVRQSSDDSGMDIFLSNSLSSCSSSRSSGPSFSLKWETLGKRSENVNYKVENKILSQRTNENRKIFSPEVILSLPESDTSSENQYCTVDYKTSGENVNNRKTWLPVGKPTSL